MSGKQKIPAYNYVLNFFKNSFNKIFIKKDTKNDNNCKKIKFNCQSNGQLAKNKG